MLRTIKTFIKDPAPVARRDDVMPGLNIVEGIVKSADPIRSPVRGQNCVAFFYRSFFIMSGGRAPTPAMHKIKEAEVYATFTLMMDGGELPVVPTRPGAFGPEDHRDLQKQYGAGFQGVEDIVLPGARVRVRGKAKPVDGQLTLFLKDIEVIDKQAISAGVVLDRKERRAKKKK